MREGILVNVDNVVATPPIGNRSDRGLSLRDLDRALARIHEEQRRLILLIGLEGASYEAAARIIDVPIGTVRSRVSRGREAIRKLMDRRDGMEAASGAAFMNAVPKRRSLVLEDEPNSEFFSGADVPVGAQSITNGQRGDARGGAPRPCRCHCYCGSSEHAAPRAVWRSISAFSSAPARMT